MSKATQIVPAILTMEEKRKKKNDNENITRSSKTKQNSLPSLRQFKHEAPIKKISFNHDSTALAVGGHDRCVTIYNTKTVSHYNNNKIAKFQHEHNILSLSWSNDGKLLASCGGAGSLSGAGGRVTLYNMVKKEIIKEFKAAAWISAVSFSHNSQLLAACGFDKKLTIYNVSEKEIMNEYAFPNTITTISWSHDDQFISCAGADCCATIIKIEIQV